MPKLEHAKPMAEKMTLQVFARKNILLESDTGEHRMCLNILSFTIC